MRTGKNHNVYLNPVDWDELKEIGVKHRLELEKPSNSTGVRALLRFWRKHKK